MSRGESDTLDSAEDSPGEVARLRAEIAELEQRLEQLDRLAHEDALVGLPNRRAFTRNLERLIDRVRRYGDEAALLFVDIDGLKAINDRLGHLAGDQALIQIARRLTQGVRASDCVARVGGDEFAVLLEHADEITARETAARLMTRVADTHLVYGDGEVPLSVAIGVASITSADGPEDVLVRADREMYATKAAD